MKNKYILITLITLIVLTLLCCLVLCVVLAAGGTTLFSSFSTSTPAAVILQPGSSPSVTPTFRIITGTPEAWQTPTPTKDNTGAAKVDGSETLYLLDQETVPINDSIDLAQRLGGKSAIPEIHADPNLPYQVGETQEFWVTNVDTNQNTKITARLRYLGDHVYIWVEEGVSYTSSDLEKLGDTFDQEIYPTNQAFFGQEWSPGIDGDPRIYIVYADGLGSRLAGYFSSADELHPETHPYSNAHEMFLINADTVFLWEDHIYGTLAHEYQHMIHWYTDKNEETWLNEGFSMLAELINNYDSGGFEYSYIGNPDLQLTDWGISVGNNGPHYGSAFLFTTYFLDRFGEEATQALVAHDENGMESIDLVLEELGIRDPLTNQTIASQDVFRDWTVANLLGDKTVADGRYAYDLYPDAPTASPSITFPQCPVSPVDHDVHQFGVDYIEINCPGEISVNLTGSNAVSILPTSPYSGDFFFWSNMGDHSNMSLERTFDFTNTNAPIEMTYQTWYDLENDYDYVFVSASLDGENWQILNTSTCTLENPSGNSYGCGLNGQSDGWQQEIVDLSPFAGETVTLRFDYVTDAAVNGNGMVIDDIKVDAIGYFADFEADDGGWEGDGFVRIQNTLPQAFIASLVTLGNSVNVTNLDLDENNSASFNLTIGDEVKSVILVVSGATPYTRQKAQYQIEIIGN